MPTLSRGLYEVLITEVLEERLGALGVGLKAIREAPRAPEVADRRRARSGADPGDSTRES